MYGRNNPAPGISLVISWLVLYIWNAIDLVASAAHNYCFSIVIRPTWYVQLCHAHPVRS